MGTTTTIVQLVKFVHFNLFGLLLLQYLLLRVYGIQTDFSSYDIRIHTNTQNHGGLTPERDRVVPPAFPVALRTDSTSGFIRNACRQNVLVSVQDEAIVVHPPFYSKSWLSVV